MTAPRTSRVLALSGSLRAGSHNTSLLRAAAACAPAGMEVTVYRELAAIPMFDEDREHDVDALAGVPRLRDLVEAADGLVIATPEYNQSFPGVLKNALDWLSRTDSLARKPIAVVGATTGRWGTRLAQAALRQVLHASDALVIPGPPIYLRDADAAFDSRGDLVDLAVRNRLAELLQSLAQWIAVTSAPAPVPRPS